jgi:hypothetical protein
MRVSISSEMAAFIADRIAGYSVEAPKQLRWQSPFVGEFAALPLYLGWTETMAIRADGELVSWSTEGDYAGVRHVEDRITVLSALVAGVERHPELRALLPERPPDASECPCRKHPLLASGKLLCGYCGGMGWLPSAGSSV